MKRRMFIKLSSVSALLLLAGCVDTNEDENSNAVAADVDLPVPTLLKATLRNGVSHYDLNLIESRHRFFEGVDTETYGIDSSYLGPTLLLKNGEDISINYTNRLSEVTTMHGHGMHLNGEMDGTTHQPIAVDETWSAQYRVNQKACTNWYHPHYMNTTAEHVYQGLAGMIIIEDSESASLDLPVRYGIDDIPLVLQDRYFSTDKSRLDYAPSNRELSRGYVGDVFIANGAIEPTFRAEAKEIRFRLLNGSNSTVYDLGFSNTMTFKQIASDNGFLATPIAMQRITLSPGERAEIVVDLTNAGDSEFTMHEFNYNKTFVKIVVSEDATAVTTTPESLTTLEPVGVPTKSRRFVLGMAGMGRFTINDKMMDANRIDERLNQGEIEEWEIVNNMMVDHNFHIHGGHFRVISRNGEASAVKANEKGYKDVVYLPAEERVKIIVQINDVTADDANPFMYHCHFLEHEDHGMMGQFTVS